MQNQIHAALVAAFSPLVCDVVNESHYHSRGDQTHYKVILISNAFLELSRVKRHQQIYAALGDIMHQIHALAIHAYTVTEWQDEESRNTHESPLCQGGSKHDINKG